MSGFKAKYAAWERAKQGALARLQSLSLEYRQDHPGECENLILKAYAPRPAPKNPPFKFKYPRGSVRVSKRTIWELREALGSKSQGEFIDMFDDFMEKNGL